MQWLSYVLCTRKVIGSLIVMAIIVAIAYACFCTHIDAIGMAKDETRLVLVGQVHRAHGDEVGNAAYELEDPSGRVFVITQVGTPSDGSLVIVLGTKNTTDNGRPLVIEQRRAGTF